MLAIIGGEVVIAGYHQFLLKFPDGRVDGDVSLEEDLPGVDGTEFHGAAKGGFARAWSIVVCELDAAGRAVRSH